MAQNPPRKTSGAYRAATIVTGMSTLIPVGSKIRPRMSDPVPLTAITIA